MRALVFSALLVVSWYVATHPDRPLERFRRRLLNIRDAVVIIGNRDTVPSFQPARWVEAATKSAPRVFVCRTGHFDAAALPPGTHVHSPGKLRNGTDDELLNDCMKVVEDVLRPLSECKVPRIWVFQDHHVVAGTYQPRLGDFVLMGIAPYQVDLLGMTTKFEDRVVVGFCRSYLGTCRWQGSPFPELVCYQPGCTPSQAADLVLEEINSGAILVPTEFNASTIDETPVTRLSSFGRYGDVVKQVFINVESRRDPQWTSRMLIRLAVASLSLHTTETNTTRQDEHVAAALSALGKMEAFATQALPWSARDRREARFLAKYFTAEINHHFNLFENDDADGQLRLYLQAWDMQRSRAEPLHSIAAMYGDRGIHQPARLYSEQAEAIIAKGEESYFSLWNHLNPSVHIATLFVRKDVYNWKNRQRYLVSLFYTGNKAEACAKWAEISSDGQFEEEVAMARRNLRFCSA